MAPNARALASVSALATVAAFVLASALAGCTMVVVETPCRAARVGAPPAPAAAEASEYVYAADAPSTQPAPEVPEAPRPTEAPQLVCEAPPRLDAVARASSSYGGWPARQAFDGKPETSWFSASGDSVAKGKSPYFELELAQATRLRRVTVLGNRDPSWPTGYSIRAGRVELFDATGALLVRWTGAGRGALHDFELVLPANLPAAKVVRFTSTDDEGGENPYGDVAIAEMVLEPVTACVEVGAR